MPRTSAPTTSLGRTVYTPTAVVSGALGVLAGAISPEATGVWSASLILVAGAGLAGWAHQADKAVWGVRLYVLALLSATTVFAATSGVVGLPLVISASGFAGLLALAFEPERALRATAGAAAWGIATGFALAASPGWSTGDLDHAQVLAVVVPPAIWLAMATWAWTQRESLDHARSTSEVARAKLARSNRAFSEARAASEEALARLATVVEALDDGLVAIGDDWAVVFANEALAQLLGVPHPQPGADIRHLLPDPMREIAEQVLTRRSHADAVVPLGDRQLQVTATPFSHDGQHDGVVLLLRDVTVEAEIDRMKSDFIAVVSHEMRTPLTSILGFTKLVRRAVASKITPALPADDAKAHAAAQRSVDNLDVVLAEGDRLAMLINDVLDLSKLESGQLTLQIADVLPADTVRAALERVAPVVNQKADAVAIALELEEVDAVPADADRMLQVLINLITNALKFTDAGTVEVGVTAQDGGVRWWVRDTGIGIPAHALDDVFDKFRQVGDAMTDRPQGTGLGLPICREIVHLHGGRIWAESEQGSGSTFHVWIPGPLEEPPPRSDAPSNPTPVEEAP